MTGQMCWLSSVGVDGEKILYLRANPNQPWKPYTALRQYSIQDYNEPRGSKGWATYQKLIKAGWKLVPSAQAQVASPVSVG